MGYESKEQAEVELVQLVDVLVVLNRQISDIYKTNPLNKLELSKLMHMKCRKRKKLEHTKKFLRELLSNPYMYKHNIEYLGNDKWECVACHQYGTSDSLNKGTCLDGLKPEVE